MSIHPQRISFLFLLVFTLFTCSKPPSHLDTFFEQLVQVIPSELILQDIKSCPLDSIYLMSPMFRSGLYSLTEEPQIKEELNDFLDSKYISPYPYLREPVLLHAFRNYLNQQPLNLIKIQFDIQQKEINDQLEWERQEELKKKKLSDIINTNHLKWAEGDTLNLTLEVDNQDGYKSILYRKYDDLPNPSTTNDTLLVKGVLVKKFHSRYLSNNNDTKLEDPHNLFFKLRILTLNDSETYRFNNQIIVGTEFILSLEKYGRPIL